MSASHASPHAHLIFKLPYATHEEGNWIVAYCPLLDVASQGETEAKARDSLIEALQAFLESCYERGVLDDVLKESGFRPASPPAEAAHDDNRTLNVPFYLLGKQDAKAVAC